MRWWRDSSVSSLETLKPLDPAIHSQVRLAVMSILISVKQADFNFLKKATETMDGNLSTHLSKLEEAPDHVFLERKMADRFCEIS